MERTAHGRRHTGSNSFIPSMLADYSKWIYHENVLYLKNIHSGELWQWNEESCTCISIPSKSAFNMIMSDYCDSNFGLDHDHCISPDGLFIYTISFDLNVLKLYCRGTQELVATQLLTYEKEEEPISCRSIR